MNHFASITLTAFETVEWIGVLQYYVCISSCSRFVGSDHWQRWYQTLYTIWSLVPWEIYPKVHLKYDEINMDWSAQLPRSAL
jgi:hypothetical protein